MLRMPWRLQFTTPQKGRIVYMRSLKTFLQLTKKQKFVISVLLLSFFSFVSESLGLQGLVTSILLALITNVFLYLILRDDLRDVLSYSIFILPFFYTLSFNLFYLLIPSRFLTRIIISVVFGFGLYSLFLTQNIFAVSSIRTITLLRSARIISFILTIVVYFLMMNIIFSARAIVPLMQTMVFLLSFLLSFQLFWIYSLDRNIISELIFYTFINSFAMLEVSVVLLFWPINATIFSLFLTGIFYTTSGLSHAWFEKRLFKGILWEYVWVGFLAVFMLLVFSNWVTL